MTYLGINTSQASPFISSFRRYAQAFGQVAELVAHAQHQADLVVPVDLVLTDIQAQCRSVSATIERVLFDMSRYRIPTPPRVVPPPGPQAGAAVAPDAIAWNHVAQIASHNSYAVPGGVAGLYEQGVRAFELDLHRGAPTELPAGWWRSRAALRDLLVDLVDHDGGRPGDWQVYHTSTSTDSEYAYLSDGLHAIAALPDADPITVFLDNKNRFGSGQSVKDLDQLVQHHLGDRVYTPADLRARAPSARSLPEAIAHAGWPTVEELRGRVLIVLTDQIEGYDSDEPQLFVAPPPRFDTHEESLHHVPDPHAVFYNANAWELDDDHLQAVAATNSVLRTYFNPACARRDASNYYAIDVGGSTVDPASDPPG